MDARRALLSELFDDAGLFPPASRPMRVAVKDHLAASKGPNAWMLGKFVCPATRVREASLARGRAPLRISLIAGDRIVSAVVVGNAPLDIEQIEVPLGDRSIEELVDYGVRAGSGAPIFVEIPAGDTATIAGLAEFEGVGAKIRCGGASEESFPQIDALAATIAACRDHKVPLKATAGLHRAVRGLDAADGFVHHGFLNLLVAAGLAHARGFEAEALAGVLGEEDPKAFSLTADELRWGEVSLSAEECAALREESFAGIGTCSFAEPVAELTSLGVLPL